MRRRYSYFVEIGNGKHKCVSAKEFKELSHHWTAGKEEKGIVIFTVDGIECGRRCENGLSLN